jgi:uncharacterized protein (TIGR00255 family)
MALHSMTGFGRATDRNADTVVSWELRSVNGKSLDIRLRLPPGLERIEPAVRQAVQRRFARGNVQATLTLERTGAAVQPVVNEALLLEVARLAQRLHREEGVAPATADGLLALRGVMDTPGSAEDEEAQAALDRHVLAVLEKALDELAAARAAEGRTLQTILLAHLDMIEALARRAEADPSREPTNIRARLAEQVKLLLDAAQGLDEDRLHMEAAILAAKADIREEIDRLLAHVASGRTLLAAAGPVGRKLDFLAQEFNREANTLCAKSNAASVTAVGLELKAIVDQFREQVQNLE